MWKLYHMITKNGAVTDDRLVFVQYFQESSIHRVTDCDVGYLSFWSVFLVWPNVQKTWSDLHGLVKRKKTWTKNIKWFDSSKESNPLSAGTGFWRPLQTVWIQMRRHKTWRLIRIQTVCYSDSIL